MRLQDYVWHGLLKKPYRLKKIIDYGTGKEILILIHGLGAKSEQWDSFVKNTDTKECRVIAYDLLGFGSSPSPDFAKYSVQEHTRSLLLSIKKDLGTKASYTVIGHSMGCIIGTHLATRRPNNTKKLILYQPPLIVGSGKKVELHRTAYKYILKRPYLIFSYIKLTGRLHTKMPGIQVSKESWLSFERSLQNTIIAQNTIFELKNIQTHTDIIFGRLDFVVSRLDVKKIAKINTNIKLHYVIEQHGITKKSSMYLKKLLN